MPEDTFAELRPSAPTREAAERIAARHGTAVPPFGYGQVCSFCEAAFPCPDLIDARVVLGLSVSAVTGDSDA